MLRRVVVTLGLLALLTPFVPLVLWAFAGEWRYPDLLPSQWSSRGFTTLAHPGVRAWEATWTSVVIGAATAVLALLVGTPAGLAIGGYAWRFKGAVILLLILPVVVPPLASAMGLHLTFIRLGIAGTIPGVVLVHLVPALPYVVLIVASVVADRSGEAEEAARTLGASPWYTFRRVTLPAIAPGVVVAGMFAFLVSWGQYAPTLLIGGGDVLTLPMLLYAAAAGSDPVVTSAVALLFALPPIVVLAVAMRWLQPGRATGV